jgi:hypothetical protein
MPAQQVRSSSLPYLMTCTNAVIHPEGMVPVEGDNETARLGTMVHALAESVVRTGEYDLTPLRNELSDSDFARAMMLTANWLDVWSRIKPYMTDPVVEKYLEANDGFINLTGHIDVHQAYSDKAFIVDYKTGRQHENHYHQMIGMPIWCGMMRASRRRTRCLRDRRLPGGQDDAELHVHARRSYGSGRNEVEAKVQDRRFVVGRKCSFCTVQGSCGAYRGYVGGAIAALTEDAHDQRVWEEMIPEDRGQLADAIYVLEKAIDRAKFGLRHAVRKAGALDIGGGNQYELIDQPERGIDAAKAMPILKKALPGWENHATFRLDDVLVAYARHIPRGRRQRAKQALLADLEKAGAIVRVTSTKMYRRPEERKEAG